MKKQINPTIKAYLIRGAFYLLLLLAVCAIPFALAQRNATKRTVDNQASKPNPAGNIGVIVNNRPPYNNGAAGAQVRRLSQLPHDARSAHPTNRGPVQLHGVPSTNRPLGTSNLLWYNGDFNQINGLANGDNWDGSGGYARVYDDFNVTAAGGWDVTSVPPGSA